MSLELLKVIVQPVVLERDEEGRIVAERIGDTIALYTLEQISKFVESLKTQLEGEANAGNGNNGDEHRLRQPSLPGEHVGSG